MFNINLAPMPTKAEARLAKQLASREKRREYIREWARRRWATDPEYKAKASASNAAAKRRNIERDREDINDPDRPKHLIAVATGLANIRLENRRRTGTVEPETPASELDFSPQEAATYRMHRMGDPERSSADRSNWMFGEEDYLARIHSIDGGLIRHGRLPSEDVETYKFVGLCICNPT